MSLELMHSMYRKDKGQLCPPLSLLFESALGKRYSPVWFGTTTNARKTNSTATNKRERMSDLDVLLYPLRTSPFTSLTSVTCPKAEADSSPSPVSPFISLFFGAVEKRAGRRKSPAGAI